MRYVQSCTRQQSVEGCTVVKVYILNQWRVWKNNNNWINPRTCEGKGGGVVATPLWGFFFSFFFRRKTSAPDVFDSCSFIPHAHVETSSVMVSYYGYETWRHKQQVVKPFWEKIHVFSSSFNNKNKGCGLNDAKCLFMCYFTFQAQKNYHFSRFEPDF